MVARRRKANTSVRQARQLAVLLFLVAAVAASLWKANRRQDQAAVPPATGASSIRLATWNLRMFSDDRRSDMLALTKIINDARFDLIAVQEVRGEGQEVDKLLNALGPPWRGTSLSPRTGSNYERFAFLYKADRLSEIGRPALVDTPLTRAFDRKPYQATFRAGQFDFTMISVHLRWTDPPRRRAEVQALADYVAGAAQSGAEKDILIVGDFNEQRSAPNFGLFAAVQWEPTIAVTTNLGSSEIYDNILLRREFTREYTGLSGAVFFDELYFQNDDARAKSAVSDHRPAWADFSTIGPDDD